MLPSYSSRAFKLCEINKMKAPDAVLSFYNEVYALIYLFAIIPFYRLNNC